MRGTDDTAGRLEIVRRRHTEQRARAERARIRKAARRARRDRDQAGR